jgi:hypothetical protein
MDGRFIDQTNIAFLLCSGLIFFSMSTACSVNGFSKAVLLSNKL